MMKIQLKMTYIGRESPTSSLRILSVLRVRSCVTISDAETRIVAQRCGVVARYRTTEAVFRTGTENRYLMCVSANLHWSQFPLPTGSRAKRHVLNTISCAQTRSQLISLFERSLFICTRTWKLSLIIV